MQSTQESRITKRAISLREIISHFLSIARLIYANHSGPEYVVSVLCARPFNPRIYAAHVAGRLFLRGVPLGQNDRYLSGSRDRLMVAPV